MRFQLLLLVIAAAFIGWLLGQFTADQAWLDQIMAAARLVFLGALKLVVGPLIFFSLVSGILQLRQAQQMRRLGTVTLAYYLGTTAIAIAIGLIAVSLFHPWTSTPPLAEVPVAASDLVLIDASQSSISQVLLGLLQQALTNPFTALAELNILAIVLNALLLGLALLVTAPTNSPLIVALDHLTNGIYRIAGWVVWLVPVGVLGIAYRMSDQLSADLMQQLVTFMGVVFAATAIHGLIVLPLLAWLLTGRKPIAFLRAISAPALVALTTSSSAATLPVSLRTAQDQLGVEPGVASFVLPLGATVNMDGTALFEGIAAVFLAYLFGVELGAAGMVAVFFVAMVASVGAPGIPSGSMAGMQVVLLAVGIPLEAIGLLLLVERPLDTFRTAVNVMGDLLACAVAQRFGVSTPPRQSSVANRL